MKKLILFMLLALPISVMADPNDLAKIKVSSKKNPLEVPLYNNNNKLTNSGKALRKLQSLNTACFKDNTTDADLTTITTELQQKNSGIKIEDIKIKFATWKKFKNDNNYVLPTVYNRPDLEPFFEGKKDNYATLSFSKCQKMNDKTLDAYIKRCTAKTNALECGVEYGCSNPTAQNAEIDAPEELETKETTCEASPDIFASDSSTILNNESLSSCLNNIPANAENITISIECCSTTVRRPGLKTDPERTNLKLTEDRQESLTNYLLQKLKVNGVKKDDVTLISDNENYYYDGVTKELGYTGTCGPLTDKDVHEPWVKKYSGPTRQYVDKNNLKTSPNFAWMLPAVSADINKPDSNMSQWRYNRIKISYQIKTLKPAPNKTITTTYTNTTGDPVVKCLFVSGQTDGDNSFKNNQRIFKTTSSSFGKNSSKRGIPTLKLDFNVVEAKCSAF